MSAPVLACACGSTAAVVRQHVPAGTGPGWTRLVCRVCREVESLPPACCTQCERPRPGLAVVTLRHRGGRPDHVWHCADCRGES